MLCICTVARMFQSCDCISFKSLLFYSTDVERKRQWLLTTQGSRSAHGDISRHCYRHMVLRRKQGAWVIWCQLYAAGLLCPQVIQVRYQIRYLQVLRISIEVSLFSLGRLWHQELVSGWPLWRTSHRWRRSTNWALKHTLLSHNAPLLVWGLKKKL